MWSIKEVKKCGKNILRNNLWTLLLIGIFMTLVIGEYVISKDGFSNLKIVEKILQDKREGKEIVFFDRENTEVILNEYFDKAISQLVTGNMTGIIKNYNEKHNVTKGVFFTIFNMITNSQTQLQNLVTSISEYENEEQLKSIIVIIASMIRSIIKNIYFQSTFSRRK